MGVRAYCVELYVYCECVRMLGVYVFTRLYYVCVCMFFVHACVCTYVGVRMLVSTWLCVYGHFLHVHVYMY